VSNCIAFACSDCRVGGLETRIVADREILSPEPERMGRLARGAQFRGPAGVLRIASTAVRLMAGTASLISSARLTAGSKARSPGEKNELVAGLHDRMPVVIGPEDRERWLKGPALGPYSPSGARHRNGTRQLDTQVDRRLQTSVWPPGGRRQ
jgi:hypothetical protein